MSDTPDTRDSFLLINQLSVPVILYPRVQGSGGSITCNLYVTIPSSPLLSSSSFMDSKLRHLNGMFAAMTSTTIHVL